MTIREALAQRIPRVRKPHWANPKAYLRLPLRAAGTYGPWAELYDDLTQQVALDVRPGSQRIVMSGAAVDEDGYEAYRGETSPWEQHAENFAKSYEEQ